MFDYLVDKEKGIVIAKIDGTKWDAVEFLERYGKFHVCDDIKKYLICDAYVGIAKCHELDEFNEDIGKELAMRRALKAHHIDLMKCVSKHVEELEKTSEHLRRKVAAKFGNNEKDLEELIEKCR